MTMQTVSAAREAAALDREALADLMEAIAEKRDRAAFIALYQHYAPRVKGYLMRLGSSHAQADEVTQEALLTVWRKAHMFDRRKSSVSTWLFTIARNRRIDVLRRERYPEYDPEDPALVPDAPEAPDDAMTATQREERVREAITGLPPEQADLIRLAFFKGQSHREIADETGIPLGTVKSRLRLAFGRLRQALDGQVG